MGGGGENGNDQEIIQSHFYPSSTEGMQLKNSPACKTERISAFMGKGVEQPFKTPRLREVP